MKKPRALLLAVIFVAVFAGVTYLWPLKALRSVLSHQSPFLAAADGSSNDAVVATYKLQEKAVQTGDGNLYFSLRSQEKLDELGDKKAQEQFRKQFAADPSVRYELDAVRTRSDHAAVLGRIKYATSAAQFYLVKIVREEGSWKTADDKTSEEPITTAALEAALPPKDGAFTRLGSPWDKIPYANPNIKRFKEDEIDWKMQATVDESFLYIRFEAKAPLPPPGVEISPEDAKSFKGMPSPHDSMAIRTGTRQESELQASANPITRGTFDESCNATSTRYFAQYSLTLSNRAGEDLFSDGTTDSFAPLIAVQDRFLDIKLPLKCLGIDSAPPPIEIREVNSVAKILPYSAIGVRQ